MLEKETFYREWVSNGKLLAFRRAEIPFRVQENIEEITVKNGSRVSQGQVLTRLESFLYENRLKKARNQYEKSLLEMEDVLVLQGRYSLKDTSQIPAAIYKMAKIKSGYNTAVSDLREAEYNYNHTVIRAPFSGIIANLEVQENNHSSAYKKFCEILDDHQMEARFYLLESELEQIATGQKVKVFPFGQEGNFYEGAITEINPMVNENGMVNVTALINNPDKQLIDGMNIRVLILKEVKDQLVVPKEAVVLRQNRQVVFTLKDSLALWNYVKTGYENGTHYTITEGLEPGMKVIITNNLNLAHETRVKEEEK